VVISCYFFLQKGTLMLARPNMSEYDATYESSISKVPEGNLLEILSHQRSETAALLSGISEEMAGYRYGPGKWSIKQVVGHVADSERIFGYRALRFARRDHTALPGYDENAFVDDANFDTRTLLAIADEFQAVRMSTLALFRSFEDAMWIREGTASGCSFSVRALGYQIAGHELHHVQILRERYL
jgi:hypothetical protein